MVAARLRGIMYMSTGDFQDLSNLASVILPSSLESYSARTTTNCLSVRFLSVEPGGAYSSDVGRNLITKDMMIVAGCAESEIPEGILSTASTYAMSYGNVPVSLKTPYSMQRINNYSFCRCDSRPVEAELRGSSALTSTGAGIFDCAYALSSVVLDAPFKTIAARAFRSCSSLLSIRLPATLTACAASAFAGCVSMNEIRFDGLSAPAITNTAFGAAAGNWTGEKQAGLHVNRVYVPEGAVGYENALSNLVDPTKCDFLFSDRGVDWIYVDGRPGVSNAHYINCRLSGVGDDGNVYT